MTTHLIQIGNSQGIRLPKTVITQLGLHPKTELEIAIQGKGITIQPKEDPRAGWATGLREMAENGDDQLMDEYLLLDDFEEEWQW